MAKNRRVIMLCPAASKDSINAKLGEIDSRFAGTFGTAEVVASTDEKDSPATHYICNWLMESSTLASIRSKLSTEITSGTLIIEKANKDDTRPGKGKSKHDIFTERNLKARDVPDKNKTI